MTIKNVDRAYLLNALTTPLNSALFTADNHSHDNSFAETKIDAMLSGLRKAGYTPAGICSSVPFLPEGYDEDWYIIFAFYDEGELYWIHFPKIVLFSLLRDEYGYKKADEIYATLEID